MTYVVTESCIKCKYTDCVDVCPVDCFHEGPNMLVIDHEECIDCTLCVAECPVEAIFAEDDVPTEQREFIAINAELCKNWKQIVERKDAPKDADEWAKVRTRENSLSGSVQAARTGVSEWRAGPLAIPQVSCKSLPTTIGPAIGRQHPIWCPAGVILQRIQ